MTSIKSENVNAIKLNLILTNVMTKIVHRKLEEEIKKTNNSVQNFLRESHDKYDDFDPKTQEHSKMSGVMKILNPKFPKTRPGERRLPFPTNLEQFDLSACYQIARTLLQLSNLDNYNELTKIRNDIFYLIPFEIDEAKFNDSINKLERIMKSFSSDPLFKEEFERIKNIKDVTSFSKLTRIESYLPPKREHVLIENLNLEELESSFTKSNLVVLYGPPGIGKTSQALQYAHNKKQIKHEWNVQWFSAETKDKFLIDLKSLHKLINPNNQKENETFEDLIKIFAHELNKVEEKKKFLFILDNLIQNEEDEWVENFLTLMPENVFILITSRNSNVLSASKSLEVKYFTKEQGEEFFKAKINKDRNLSKKETDLLEEYFNGGQVLPYDLNLLVNDLNKNELFTIETFLTGYKKMCDIIFDKLYEVISKQSKESWSTLEYCSFIDPDAIPVFLAMKFVETNDEINFQTNVLNILKINGVVEVFKYKSTDSWCIKIHRRTQEMIQKIVNDK